VLIESRISGIVLGPDVVAFQKIDNTYLAKKAAFGIELYPS
jgi:hypothetical protein